MSDQQPIENWREITGFPGYRVSDQGRVQSGKGRGNRKPGTTWRDLNPTRMRNGYLEVTLRLGDGAAHKRYVHRLVLTAFVGPCPDGMECCHGDGTRINNHLSNLRWDTRSENLRDAVRHGTLTGHSSPGESHPMAKLTAEQAAEIRRLRREGHKLKALALRFRVSMAQVSRIALGQGWLMPGDDEKLARGVQEIIGDTSATQTD